MDVDGQRLLVVAGFRLGGSTGAAQVGNDDRVMFGERRHDRMPHVAGLRVAVQQDDGAAAAGDPVVQSNAVDLREALRNTAHERRLFSSCDACISADRTPGTWLMGLSSPQS